MNLTNTITFYPGERRNCRPRPKIGTPAWAEMFREVKTGPAQGRWRNDFTPYTVKPMEVMDLPWVRKVFLNWAPQTGKTATAMNFLMKVIDSAPGPAMYLMADEKGSRRIVRRQIIPTFRGTPKIARLMSKRADDTSLEYVRFGNGMDLMMGWATSPAILASESIQYIFYDEPGKYPDFAGKESDPFTLGDVRTNWYPHTSKQIYFSTPNLDGDAWDRIVTDEPDETWHYEARCPFCDKLQEMKFRRISWGGYKDPRTVIRKKSGRYQCVECNWDWDDHTRNQAVSAGEWVCENPKERATAVSFSPLPSWYSPVVSLSKPAAAYLKGQADPTKLQGFITQQKCQAFKETIKDVNEEAVLKLRDLSMPPHIVPAGYVALTAGIDMQKRSFWYVVLAWTPELDCHLVDYGQVTTWADLELLLFNTRFQVAEKRFHREDAKGAKSARETADINKGRFLEENSLRSSRLGGSNGLETVGRLPIWRAGLDTGGGDTVDGEWTRTEEAYMWLRRHGRRGVVFGTKGASRPQINRVRLSIIDKMRKGNRPIPGGLELRFLDAGAFKSLIHFRMERRKGESQRFTLHNETGLDFARQILAEELRRDRRGRQRWVQVRGDNHLLDCVVIAMACADNQWTPALAMIASQGEGIRDRRSEVGGRTSPEAVNPVVDLAVLHSSGGPGAGVPGRVKPDWFRNRRVAG